MPLIDLQLDNVPELKTLATGTKVDVQLLSATYKESESGSKYIQAKLKVLGVADVKMIFCALFFPKEGDDEDKVNNSRRRIAAFCDAFGLPKSALDVTPDQEIPGWTGQVAKCTLKETEDEEYGRKNEVKSWLPRGSF